MSETLGCHSASNIGMHSRTTGCFHCKGNAKENVLPLPLTLPLTLTLPLNLKIDCEANEWKVHTLCVKVGCRSHVSQSFEWMCKVLVLTKEERKELKYEVDCILFVKSSEQDCCILMRAIKKLQKLGLAIKGPHTHHRVG